MDLLAAFARLAGLPGGRALFTRAVCFKAPYFGSIKPRFEELSAWRAVVSLKNRRRVHNHIATVHAIAMCNLCELAAGTMIEASLPKNLRWIPRGMTVRYLKKADTDLTGTAELPQGVTAAYPGGDVVIPVRVRNTAGDVVMEADISMYVSPRPARAAS